MAEEDFPGRGHGQGDEAGIRRHRRHHPGALGGVPAAGFHGRFGGGDLPAVLGVAGGLDPVLRLPRPDLHPGAVRHAAQFRNGTTRSAASSAPSTVASPASERYSLLNSKLVSRAGRFMLVYAGLVAMLGYFYLRLPEAFVPAEDLGYMVVDVQLPPGASRVRTDATGEELGLPQVPRGGGFGVPDLGLQLLRPGRQCRAGLPDLQGLVRARRRAVGRRRDRRAERAFRAARRWHGHGRVAATDQRSG